MEIDLLEVAKVPSNFDHDLTLHLSRGIETMDYLNNNSSLEYPKYIRPRRLTKEEKLSKVLSKFKKMITCKCSKITIRVIKLGISLWTVADLISDAFNTNNYLNYAKVRSLENQGLQKLKHHISLFRYYVGYQRNEHNCYLIYKQHQRSPTSHRELLVLPHFPGSMVCHPPALHASGHYIGSSRLFIL